MVKVQVTDDNFKPMATNLTQTLNVFVFQSFNLVFFSKYCNVHKENASTLEDIWPNVETIELTQPQPHIFID